MRKLELKNLKVKKITSQEMSKVSGGFTLFGIVCSVDNKCTRLTRQSNQYCSRNEVCVIEGPNQ
ncbi:hypothetical protein [Flavobacterium sp.]|uniref:hypothetical protein n=1 Tax=Flavobacterium sp. TaxID=239 RepID=UPI0040472935